MALQHNSERSVKVKLVLAYGHKGVSVFGAGTPLFWWVYWEHQENRNLSGHTSKMVSAIHYPQRKTWCVPYSGYMVVVYPIQPLAVI